MPPRPARGRKPSKRGPGPRSVAGQSFRLADEVRYIQRRAAAGDSRIVSIAQLVLFSTQTGDAWVLDPADHLAMPVARDGEPLPAQMVETSKKFVIGWTGQYRIDGDAFVYADNESKGVRAILGYPTALIEQQSRT